MNLFVEKKEGERTYEFVPKTRIETVNVEVPHISVQTHTKETIDSNIATLPHPRVDINIVDHLMGSISINCPRLNEFLDLF